MISVSVVCLSLAQIRGLCFCRLGNCQALMPSADKWNVDAGGHPHVAGPAAGSYQGRHQQGGNQ
jgi:hypothetical protein